MKRICLSIVFVSVFCGLAAQTFQGSVLYRNQRGELEPLPFAQVYHIGEEKIIETDADGLFRIPAPRTSATLVATYVGYSRDTVIVEPGTLSAQFVLEGENGLDEAVVTGKNNSTLSRVKSVKTEIISAAGLCKMACCALAESFENSASVTVGYSDAVTGARQIKLLGLSGTYTQMLDENRPVMRGLAAPFGLQCIPGQWLESIQIAKGPASVINGLEAVTGSINMEHRKPTDETPLFLQLYGSTDAMFEGNAASALQINDKWSVINLAHVGRTASKMDHNKDGFRDEPEDLHLDFASRWLYYSPTGTQVRFGVSLLSDNRLGGQMDYKKGDYIGQGSDIIVPWGSEIRNRGIDAYAKIGIPLDPEQKSSLGIVLDFDHHEFDSNFGRKLFNGVQDNFFANFIYQNQFNENHRLNAGITARMDNIRQTAVVLKDFNADRKEAVVAGFGEYTYTLDDKVTFVGGLNLEYNALHGWLFSPRANFKYSFTDDLIVRLIGGRGYRTANIFTDNLGAFSTGRSFVIDNNLDYLEDAWTFGGNLTLYLPIGDAGNPSYLSFDYFHNLFNRQVIADQEYDLDCVSFYNLDGRSFTNTYQVDFSVDPVERFNIIATFRYSDAKVTLKGQGLVERPLTSRFKGVLTMQYATPMNIWTFDVTAQLNGPMKLPYFAADAWGMETSPVYPILYAQVTRKFRGVDVYVGGENLTNYRQKDAILSAENPYSTGFNASCVWGPLMGIKVYAGLRLTIWK